MTDYHIVLPTSYFSNLSLKHKLMQIMVLFKFWYSAEFSFSSAVLLTSPQDSCFLLTWICGMDYDYVGIIKEHRLP